MSDDELRRVWRTADVTEGPFGPYIKTLLLTAARRNEVSEMRRGELTEGGATWVLSSTRSKTGREITLPLSRAVQDIIGGIPEIAGGGFIFTFNGRQPIRGLSLLKQRLDEASGVVGWRLHDLRRTARTLLSRAGVSADTSERCLGHALGGIRATYDKHRYLEEMRTAFEALAGQIEAIIRG